MRHTIPEESLQCIHKICAEHDCSLVDYAVRGSEHRLILDLFIDNRPGVSLDLCSAVSRAIRDESATDKFLSDVYLLEVSSPGVDRPLTFNWQYEKHVGRLLQLTLNDGSQVEGTLVSVSPEHVQICPRVSKGAKKASAELESIDLPFDHISSSTVKVALR